MMWILTVMELTLMAVTSEADLMTSNGDATSLAGVGKAIGAVLEVVSQPFCSITVITDELNTSDEILKEISDRNQQLGVFKVMNDEQNITKLDAHFTKVISEARKLRRLSRCAMVIVISEDQMFLERFAERSLQGRLLIWSSKLLVVSRLSFNQLDDLLMNFWTFSMMNAAFLNLDVTTGTLNGGVYAFLPYSPKGANIVQVAFWSKEQGLRTLKHHHLFPQKFVNFYGSQVNVTALPYTPHWVEDITVNTDGTKTKIYSGTDYYLLATIAETLNFTIYVLPTTSWNEVATRVEERVSFMATVFHNVLPQRLERYDYSYTYEYGSLDFSVAKPGLKPQWQALYYPLTDGVWLSILAVLIPLPFILYKISTYNLQRETERKKNISTFIEVVFSTMLAQPLNLHLPSNISLRLLLGTWLVFAFIIGTAYRGNLTASLTIPKYPPRVETVEQLVNTFDSVTMPPFGNEFIRFFKQSDNQLYKKLAERMHIVPSVMDGLRQAVEKKEAHVAGKRFMEQKIAKHFSHPDGSTKLYVGRESILPGISAWPIPHDAPYRIQIDSIMMAVIEGGLYEQWSRNMLENARRESRKRQHQYKEEQEVSGDVVVEEDEMNSMSRKRLALTIVHMQGPLMLLLIGLITGCLIFTSEIITALYFHKILSAYK